MDEAELARSVADELGGDIARKINRKLGGDDSAEDRIMGFDEAAAIAGFIVACAQVTVDIWQARQDRAHLVQTLAEHPQLLSQYPRLDPEKRLGFMAKVLSKFLPDDFGRPGNINAKREFVGGATVLVPFADQNWWIVYQDAGWEPDEDDGPGLVRVDVPRGFVTDLASVPSYLWAVVQKTGRYGNAAIYHDWLYWEQGCSREQADAVFNCAMKDMGVDSVTRRLITTGVRVFGAKYWAENARAKKEGGKRVLRQFPDKPNITWEEWRKQEHVFS